MSNGLRKKTNGDGFIEPKSTGQIIFTKDVLITSEQLKNVLASPIRLLPELGSNQMYAFPMLAYSVNFITTEYIGYGDGYTVDLYSVSYGNIYDRENGSSITTITGLNNPEDHLFVASDMFFDSSNNVSLPKYPLGKAIYLASNGIDLAGSAGDGTLNIHLTYEIITF